MNLLANQLGGWMMFAGLALMVGILFRRYTQYYRKLKRKNGRIQPSRSQRQTEGIHGQRLADAPPEVLRWQVEMHETARELKAELDTKIGLLQAMVQMADERIARLDARTEPSRFSEPMQQQNAAELPSSMKDLRPSTFESGDLFKATTSSTALKESNGFGLPGSEDMRRVVYQLADRGLNALEIAQEMGRAHGDIEFILALRSAD